MSEPLIGEIRMTGCKFAPHGRVVCNAQSGSRIAIERIFPART